MSIGSPDFNIHDNRIDLVNLPVDRQPSASGRSIHVSFVDASTLNWAVDVDGQTLRVAGRVNLRVSAARMDRARAGANVASSNQRSWDRLPEPRPTWQIHCQGTLVDITNLPLVTVESYSGKSIHIVLVDVAKLCLTVSLDEVDIPLEGRIDLYVPNIGRIKRPLPLTAG